MKNLIALSLLLILLSCSGNSTKSAKSNTSTAKVQPESQLEDRTYPFMELKKLYNENWENENDGNPLLDGKEVVVTGIVYSSGKHTMLQDDGSQKLIGAIIRFREKEHSDEDDFTFDMECNFDVENAIEAASQEKGTPLKIKGKIQKQEWWIRPEVKFTSLVLVNCELVKE